MPNKTRRTTFMAAPRPKMTLWGPLIIVACIGIAGWWFGYMMAADYNGQKPVVADKSERRDFSLLDTSDQRVSLDTYRGKWLLLFFGFTNCPEACPTTLLKLGNILRDLKPRAITLQPIFITVDPERDRPEVLKGYLANFGDDFVGLSGSPEELAAAAKAYGVYFAKRPTEAGDYTVDHSTALYLVSPDGNLVRMMGLTQDPEDFIQELLTEMKQRK